MKQKLQVKKYTSATKALVKKKKPYVLKKRKEILAKAKAIQSKVSKVDALDQLLLKMTAKPYNQILKQIKIGKRKLSDERKLALQIGTRILEKAKEVRDSLMPSSKKNN